MIRSNPANILQQISFCTDKLPMASRAACERSRSEPIITTKPADTLSQNDDRTPSHGKNDGLAPGPAAGSIGVAACATEENAVGYIVASIAAIIGFFKWWWEERNTNKGFLFCGWLRSVGALLRWYIVDKFDQLGELAIVLWCPGSIFASVAVSLGVFFCFDSKRISRKEDLQGSSLYADLTLPLVKPATVFVCQVAFFVMYAHYIDEAYEEHRRRLELDVATPETFWFLTMLDVYPKEDFVCTEERAHPAWIQFVSLFALGAFLQFAILCGRGEYEKQVIDRIGYWFAVGDFILEEKSGSSLSFKKGDGGGIEQISHASVYLRAAMGLIVNVGMRLSIEFLLPFQLAMSSDANEFVTGVLGAYFIIELDYLEAFNLTLIRDGKTATYEVTQSYKHGRDHCMQRVLLSEKVK